MREKLGHPMNRRLQFISLLFLTILLTTGCFFNDERNKDLSEFFEEPASTQKKSITTTSTKIENQFAEVDATKLAELLDLSIAPRSAIEVAQKFYALISAERFEDAYRLVSLEIRETLPVEKFSERYRDIWKEATITELKWEVAKPSGENIEGLDVTLTYQTDFFGNLTEQIFTPTRRQPNWVIDWTPDLIFNNLGTAGFLVHKFIDVPNRGEIFDRNGTPLAIESEIAIIGISHDIIQDVDKVIEVFVKELQLDERVVRDLVFQDLPPFFFIPIALWVLDSLAS